MTDAKRCTKCHLFKHDAEYHKAVRGKRGLSAVCKECDSLRHKVSYAAKMDRTKYERVAERAQVLLDRAERRATFAERNRLSSRRWQQSNLAKHSEYEHRRRARVSAALVAPVDREEIWLRDGGICGICRALADRDDWHLDHVVPLYRGGTHEPANVQVSHPVCNSRKGAKLMSELANVA